MRFAIFARCKLSMHAYKRYRSWNHNHTFNQHTGGPYCIENRNPHIHNLQHPCLLLFFSRNLHEPELVSSVKRIPISNSAEHWLQYNRLDWMNNICMSFVFADRCRAARTYTRTHVWLLQNCPNIPMYNYMGYYIFCK